MIINYIANLRLPTERAYGIQIAKTCEALAMLGNSVYLFYPHRKNPIKENIYQYYSVKNNFTATRIYSPDFYLPGFLDKYTVILKNFISALMLALKLRSAPGVIYSRDELPVYILSFLRNPDSLIFEAHKFSKPRIFFYKRFKKKGIKIVTISDGLKREFLKLEISASDILVSPDGVDLGQFKFPETKKECRDMFGLPLDKKIIMYSGHFYDWKGVDTLLEAAKTLPDIFLLVLVGDHSVTKDKNMLFLGRLPHKQIPKVLRAADILVLPNSGKRAISRIYTSPLKLFEYMASGVPMVASNLPSIKEILNENKAIFFESDNPQDLAKKILHLSNNPELGIRNSRQALENIEKYTWVKRGEAISYFINGTYR